MNIEKILKEEVQNLFSARQQQESSFFKTPLVKSLQSKGFNFHLFSVGAKPDGFYLSHKDFQEGDEYGNVLSLKYTGDTLEAALDKLKKLNPDLKNLYLKLQAKALEGKLAVPVNGGMKFRDELGLYITLQNPKQYSEWVRKAEQTKQDIRVVVKRGKELNHKNPYLSFYEVGFVDPRFLPWGPTPDSSRAHIIFPEGGKHWSNGTFDSDDVWVDVHFKVPHGVDPEKFWKLFVDKK